METPTCAAANNQRTPRNVAKYPFAPEREIVEGKPHDEAGFIRYTCTVGNSRLPRPDRRLSGRLWTSVPENLCLVHERKHDFRRTEERTGQFPSRFAFRNSHRVLRDRRFLGKPLYSVQIALFPSPYLRCDCRLAGDGCWP